MGNDPNPGTIPDRLRRVHGLTREGREDPNDYKDPDIYKRVIPKGDSLHLDHARSKTFYLWEFNPEHPKVMKDKRVTYPGHPYIMSAFKYHNVETKAADFDGVRMSIPMGSPPGHYIVHWVFNGYSECTDVHLHDVAIPEDEIYGVDLEGDLWNKIDHCQYVVGKSAAVTACLPVKSDSDITDCMKAADNYRTNNENFGLNVVTVVNPAAVPAWVSDDTNIPWDQAVCAVGGVGRKGDSMGDPKWNYYKGKVTTNKYDWDSWAAEMVIKPGWSCRGGTTPVGGRMPLISALIRCRITNQNTEKNNKCAVLTWLNSGDKTYEDDFFSSDPARIFNFNGCVKDRVQEKRNKEDVLINLNDAPIEKWVPTADSPWYMFTLSEAQPIGRVFLNDLQATGVSESSPVVVVVSDEPCSGSTCPTGKVCKTITSLREMELPFGQAKVPQNTNMKHQTVVNCEGKTGKYVYVQAQGKNRALGILKLSLTRPEPLMSEPGMRACYGLVPREATEAKPKFYTTSDPQDPAFYSTCYERIPNTQWRTLPDQKPILPHPRWHYNGMCLDCENYRQNYQGAAEEKTMDPPIWLLADKCYDCGAYGDQIP